MRTRLTDVLQVEHPVMLAGMGGVSYHRLVAAVSEAGGFGCMGASTMGAQQMRDEIAKVRELTDKPFGVDLLTAAPGDMTAKVNDIIDGGGSVFVAGLGVPRDVVDLCHSRNVLVVSMCGKVRHAIAAVEAGCDIVVAQGTEAGGHTGKIATFALVPQIVDAVGERVPVVAAGGIVDGRGLAASAGPRGRWHLGRHPVHRHAGGQQRAGLQGGAPADPRGRDHDHPRVHRQDVPRDREQLHQGLRRRRRRARAVPDAGRKSMEEGANHLGGDPSTPDVDPDREFWPAGQGVGSIDELVPAGELVERFVREAEEALGTVRQAFA